MKRRSATKSEVAESSQGSSKRRRNVEDETIEGFEVTLGRAEKFRRLERGKVGSSGDQEKRSATKEDSGKESNEELEKKDKIRDNAETWEEEKPVEDRKEEKIRLQKTNEDDLIRIDESDEEDKRNVDLTEGYLGDDDETFGRIRRDVYFDQAEIRLEDWDQEGIQGDEIKPVDLDETEEEIKPVDLDETEEEIKPVDLNETEEEDKRDDSMPSLIYVNELVASSKESPPSDVVVTTASSSEAKTGGSDVEVEPQHEDNCDFTLEDFEWKLTSLTSLETIQNSFDKAKAAALKSKRKGKKKQNLAEKVDTEMNPAVESYLVGQRELVESMKALYLSQCECPNCVTSCNSGL